MLKFDIIQIKNSFKIFEIQDKIIMSAKYNYSVQTSVPKVLIYDLKWTIWLTMINNVKRSLLQGVPINLGIQRRFLHRLRTQLLQ